MNETMFVIPAPGLRVLDPITHQPLAAEGEEKPRSTHWLRRLREGDVREGKAPKTNKAQEK